MSKIKIVSLEEAKSAFDPYSHLWNKWKCSDACFLNKEQIVVIETYLKTGELKKACARLGISETDAIEKLNKATFALFICESLFFQWMFSVFYLQSRSWFIQLPISKAPIPIYYRKKIKKLKCSSLKETLEKYTALDLYQFWSKEDASDFIEMMVHYQCGSLLRMGSNN